jgi:hypothetical protein
MKRNDIILILLMNGFVDVTKKYYEKKFEKINIFLNRKIYLQLDNILVKFDYSEYNYFLVVGKNNTKKILFSEFIEFAEKNGIDHDSLEYYFFEGLKNINFNHLMEYYFEMNNIQPKNKTIKLIKKLYDTLQDN